MGQEYIKKLIKKKTNVNVNKNIVAVQRVTSTLLYLAHGSDAHAVRIVHS